MILMQGRECCVVDGWERVRQQEGDSKQVCRASASWSVRESRIVIARLSAIW